jgi:hypothetical protein
MLENHCTCYNCQMIDEPTDDDLDLEQRLDIIEAMLRGVRTNITRLDWRLQDLEEWAKRTQKQIRWQND